MDYQININNMQHYMGEKDSVRFYITTDDYIEDGVLDICRTIFEKKKDVWYN